LLYHFKIQNSKFKRILKFKVNIIIIYIKNNIKYFIQNDFTE
jgi:hypothetical protein